MANPVVVTFVKNYSEVQYHKFSTIKGPSSGILIKKIQVTG